MGLLRRIALGLVATASALVASFATIQSPSNNLASTYIDNSTSQQTIVEEKETTTIYNSAPQTQELDQETKTQPLKISVNPDKTIKIQIDKNFLEKSNPINIEVQSSKFLTILPLNISIGQPASAYFKRNTYKISDISRDDIKNYCKKTFPNLNIVDAGIASGTSLHCAYGPNFRTYYRSIADLCESRHPGYGTWVGDGGRSCYDSYRTWN
jgi:hypothetical protein